jgi:hypothetical protein
LEKVAARFLASFVGIAMSTGSPTPKGPFRAVCLYVRVAHFRDDFAADFREMQNAKCKMQNELSGEPQPNPELPADRADARRWGKEEL